MEIRKIKEINMKNKRMSGFLAALMAVVLLTGCGSTADSVSAPQDEASGSLSGESSTSSDADSGASKENAEESSREESETSAALSLEITEEEATLDNIEDFITIGSYQMELQRDESLDTSSYDEAVAPMVGYYYFYPEGTAIEEGMTATIDYEGKIDGVAFEGGSGENYDLRIGSHTFIDDFEDQLVGACQGDTVTVRVTFPEDYSGNEELDGKDAEFTCTVKAVKKPAWTFFYEGCEVKKLPQKTYDTMLDRIKSTYEYYAAQYSKSYDEYLEAVGLTEEDVQETAVEETQQALAALGLMKALGYTVDSETYQKYQSVVLTASGYEDMEAANEDGITEEQVGITASYYTANYALLHANGYV